MFLPTVDDIGLEAQENGGLKSWRIGQCAFLLQCSPAVLHDIRAQVERGRALPHGGREVGGVLFGVQQQGRLCLLAARPLACEHAFGPGFVLSEKDEERLRHLLAAPSADPGLNGLQALGWYHSHLRSKIFLSDRDRQVQARYFPGAAQVALVVHPRSDGVVRAGFFFEEPSGAMRTEAAYEEFTIDAPAPKAAPAKAAPPARRPQPRETAPPEDSHETEGHETVCPKCHSAELKRSRRTGPVERLYGAFGYYPYRCQECLSRSFVKIDTGLLRRAGRKKRPEERHRARLRHRREFLLWGGGIVGFLAILYYVVRDTGPKQEQP